MSELRVPPEVAESWFYARWIVAGREPKGQRVIDPPRPAVAHARLYDGTVTDVPVHVVAVGQGAVCVSQDVEHGQTRTWHAWVNRDLVRVRDDQTSS